jgi:hypothetical protein
MGMLECRRHGIQGIYEVCQHIHEDLKAKFVPQMYTTSILPTHLCKFCWQKGRFQELNKIDMNVLTALPVSEAEAIVNKLTQELDSIQPTFSWCYECFKEVELEFARANNKVDPFEAYEHTLLYENEATIRQLENYLLQNYKFENTRISLYTSTEALFIHSGGITHPLCITIYYVTQRSEQEKIITLIEDFFHNINLKQRRIQFYENELVLVKGEVSHHVTREKPLLDLLIK